MVDLAGGKNPSHGGREGLSFPEIVGQEDLKQALLAVAANGDLDGLLIRGEKGTAKSTAVRALRDLLPEQRAVADCPYGCPPDDPSRQCADCRERTDPPTATRSVPLVTLPLGATRDRVVGTLSVADALGGDHEFDPGLLARANRGFLYVDEVNLLDDHLVDVVLDAAASGSNRVERDGVSVRHPADFTLVGTMNPEEGDLRPQLRDRFGLCATVTGCEDLDDRVAIVERALGEDTSGTDVEEESGTTVGELRDRLRRASDRLDDVTLPTEFAREIAELCRDAGLDGHRGDIATARAARTIAALDGRMRVIEPDVRRAAELALPHRLRSRPFEDAPDPEDLLDEQFGDSPDGENEGNGDESDGSAGDDGADGAHDEGESESQSSSAAEERSDETERREDANPDDDAGDSESGKGGGTTSGKSESSGDGEPDRPEPDSGRDPPPSAEGRTADSAPDDVAENEASEDAGDRDRESDAEERTPLLPGASRAPRAEVGSADAPELTAPDVLGEVEGSRGGGRARSRSADATEGPRVRTRRAESNDDVDAAASVRAAGARGATSVESRDLRQSVRQTDASTLVVFVVDASASMRPAMRAAKGTVLELLQDAYQERDEVAFVAFAGDDAEVLLPPTDSVTLAARHLKDLPTGDRTPLPAGLRSASDVLDRADPAAGVVVVVTDGRANVADGSPVKETRAAARRLAERDPRVLVVDAGEGERGRRGLTDLVATETGGERVPLSALSAERVDAAAGAADES
ncbi:VWA domain-containing protein [Halobellus rubicundus]|uniref:VWA domain-containing protein n=1 Tax=Halobellus rubicundus TaxID=2996466 RepID=A0ABD5MHC9_9EURY